LILGFLLSITILVMEEFWVGLRVVIRRNRERFVSAVVIHEVYRLTLERENRETAVLRASLLEKDFKVDEVNAEIAKTPILMTLSRKSETVQVARGVMRI